MGCLRLEEGAEARGSALAQLSSAQAAASPRQTLDLPCPAPPCPHGHSLPSGSLHQLPPEKEEEISPEIHVKIDVFLDKQRA